jgi:hypothetical protein
MVTFYVKVMEVMEVPLVGCVYTCRANSFHSCLVPAARWTHVLAGHGLSMATRVSTGNPNATRQRTKCRNPSAVTCPCTIRAVNHDAGIPVFFFGAKNVTPAPIQRVAQMYPRCIVRLGRCLPVFAVGASGQGWPCPRTSRSTSRLGVC